jgi:hypothetical protein
MLGSWRPPPAPGGDLDEPGPEIVRFRRLRDLALVGAMGWSGSPKASALMMTAVIEMMIESNALPGLAAAGPPTTAL